MSSTQSSSVPHYRPAASARKSRLIPFLIALAACTTLSVTLGFGAWYLFGKSPAQASVSRPRVLTGEASPTPGGDAVAGVTVAPAPAGMLPVTGGVVELGGGEGDDPARKVAVESFFIAETETTNDQYREFVGDANRKTPAGWRKGDFPLGQASLPVTGVTWQDAADYCQWLSKKTGAATRLPGEAEWELAARGGQSFKYPWGNEWDERAAASEKTRGWVHAVKSFPAGRSPVGAYDMAGNVWEWTADEARAAEGNPPVDAAPKRRVIKGGAANENPALISATSRDLIPENHASAFVGFRCAVASGAARPQ